VADPIVAALIGSIAAALTWLGIRLTRRYAVQEFRRPEPEADREPAGQPGGGLAVLVVVLMLFMPIGLWISDPNPVVRFALAGAMMAVIGFFEDLRTLPRPLRISAQVVAALIFVPATPITIIGLPRMELILPELVGIIIALVWVVGLSTVYTYMDNVDGLAGGHAAMVGLLWTIIALTEQNALVALLGVLILGTNVGFLVHNLSPARIFMGEVGGTFVGFSLAALPLLMQGSSPRLAVTGALFVALIVFDAALTFTIYVVRGKYRKYPERSHLYQRLLSLGDSPVRVTMLYLFISACFGVAGMSYWRETSWAALIIVVLACVTLFVWIKGRETSRRNLANRVG
jgi:UDP-N-acetylmuramyl pentapeptide phosphotransferase/UDP-N-acetylglucosamine-1-phosphate transferase